MSRASLWIVLSVLSLSLLGAGCAEDEPATECTAGEARCDSDGALQTCTAAGTWGAPDPCPTSQMCMTMSSGLTHCMLMSAMDASNGDGMAMDNGTGMEAGPDAP